ncbi:anti-sigma factor RsbA family regulatory protein [Winogradskya humida]|uniref:Anti-sigma regulatory factor n=1 Tax=Winogradskya humida TaxID=113566 RepID=A0ABQ3ZVT9_9ACTN|nr:anti-sigma factor RsbA family regulatory protein [Actinoplanes humidus]GIE22695.1 anti-sigma regulatory factor [Actinoplanes humidus]
MAFSHSAFLYDSDSAYASTLTRFVREALADDEAVAVAAAPDRIGLLRDALDDDADAVRFLPADEWYVRPVRTIAGWAHILKAAAASGRSYTRMIGQIPYGGQPATWVRFEAALNRSLAGSDAHLLCPYDRRTLPAELVAAAGRTHPRVHDGIWLDSAEYQPPENLLAELPEPPWPVAGEPALTMPIVDSVAELRSEIRDRAGAESWLPPDRVESLMLALSELATNGIRHGGMHRELRIWVTPEAVIGEVTDDGAAPLAPLAGYLPPAPGVAGGMGLWLVHQLCDSMAIHRSDGITRARFALRRSGVSAASPVPATSA